MASPSSEKAVAAEPRPAASRISSFPSHRRDDGGNTLKPLRRAQTSQTSSPLDRPQTNDRSPSAFEGADDSDPEDGIEITRASIELDVLPIELVSMTDSFIESLNAKVHSQPPNIDKLSQLFQEFYAQASSHINTHINTLATMRSREASPSPSATSLSSAASRLRSKASALNIKEKPRSEAEQQMITAEELASKKKARKALEVKRRMLEEAVERRLCEGIYTRIYRHKSTQDEAQDDKLRSKTAALSLVGIGPADLGIDLGDRKAESLEAPEKQTDEIRAKLEQARKDIARMHKSRYPLGKLNSLKAAHRSIVDTIAHFHPSASADEIMPMLIFTLITMPPEDLHVISDARFVQNFRWEPRLAGEDAYCITNLEAAISFLQNVDLATLRSDELPSGPPKGQPGTPKTETFPPAYQQGQVPGVESSKDDAIPSKNTAGLKSASDPRSRRLSDLVNTPAQAFGAASDAVFATADQSLKTVSSSLDNSFKFLLGKIKEQQDSPRESIVVPRTLDDARKLVSTPPPEDEPIISGASSAVDAEERKQPREDRVLSMLGGRRDRSTDSAVSGRSASSSKPSTQQGAQPPPVLDQMRNHISNSFNPMARFSNQIGMIRSFGRNVSTPPATTQNEATKVADGGDLGTAFPDIAAALPPKPSLPKISPPNKRFMELQNPGDLKIGEVLELLRDYRRLAGALNKMGAFEEK